AAAAKFGVAAICDTPNHAMPRTSTLSITRSAAPCCAERTAGRISARWIWLRRFRSPIAWTCRPSVRRSRRAAPIAARAAALRLVFAAAALSCASNRARCALQPNEIIARAIQRLLESARPPGAAQSPGIESSCSAPYISKRDQVDLAGRSQPRRNRYSRGGVGGACDRALPHRVVGVARSAQVLEEAEQVAFVQQR